MPRGRRASGVMALALAAAMAPGGAVASTFAEPALIWATAASPANDAFGNAMPIEGASGQVQGTNLGATKELLEPAHAGEAGGASVWYRWVAPATGTVILDTQGSDFDTLLAVYTGLTIGVLSPVASNDDTVKSSQSRVVFEAVAGTTYHIAVDGYGAATGTIHLRWLLVTAPPVNDAFAAAHAIGGGSGHVEATNARATKDAGEPDHAGNPGGASVWYRWTAPSAGAARFDTAGSDFDTLLAVYVGDAVAALTEVTSNDDEPSIFPASAVTFDAVAGTIYRIAVDGFDGAVGRVHLSWSLEASTTINVVGNTWFASGELVRSGPRGSVISAFATGVAPNTSYRLVSSPAQDQPNRSCMADVVPVNPTVRPSNARGFIATTSGVLDRPPGRWDVCFLSVDGSTIGAPVRFEVVG